jgi:hypothetical protein
VSARLSDVTSIMAYRSIKRVIGETSLERKCRVLFVFCLSVLLFAAFYLVESITEQLVEGTAVRQGRNLVDTRRLLRYHWEEVWETKPEAAELAREMSRDLQTQHYKWTILHSTDPASIELARTVELPANEEEEAILQELKPVFSKQMTERGPATGGDDPLERDRTTTIPNQGSPRLRRTRPAPPTSCRSTKIRGGTLRTCDPLLPAGVLEE